MEFPTLLIKQHVIKGILKIVMSIGGVLWLIFFIRKYFFIKYCRSIKKYVIKISIVMEVVLIYTRIVNSNTILYCIQVCHCQVEKIAITHFYTLLLRLLVNGLTQHEINFIRISNPFLRVYRLKVPMNHRRINLFYE